MIIPVGKWQMLWMSCISLCEVMSFLGREGPGWTASLGPHCCQGRELWDQKLGWQP